MTQELDSGPAPSARAAGVTLPFGAVADGQFLKRVGGSIVGAAVAASSSGPTPWTDSRFSKVPLLSQTLGIPGRFETASVPASAGGPFGVCFDGTYIWVTNFTGGNVDKIDPRTRAVVASVAVGTQPLGLCFDGKYIWVANSGTNTVSQIDATANAVVNTVTVGTNPFAVCFDGTYVWSANINSNDVSQINASTHTVINTVALGGGTNPAGCCYDGTYIWVTCDGSNQVKLITPSTHTVFTTINLPGTDSGPWGIAYDGTYIWVANHGGGTGHSVTQINAATQAILATIEMGASTGPEQVCFDGIYIWVSLNAGGTGTQVAQIYAADATLVRKVTVGQNPKFIAFDGTFVWVACLAAGDNETILAGPYSPLRTGSQVVYVRKTGNDLTGDGSAGAPFLTVSQALASITDASSSKIYLIDVGPGVFSDALNLKPFVFISGAGAGTGGRTSFSNPGSPTSITGAITTTDPGWNSTGGSAGFSNLLLDAPGSLTLNFNGSAQNCAILLKDVDVLVNVSLASNTNGDLIAEDCEININTNTTWFRVVLYDCLVDNVLFHVGQFYMFGGSSVSAINLIATSGNTITAVVAPDYLAAILNAQTSSGAGTLNLTVNPVGASAVSADTFVNLTVPAVKAAAIQGPIKKVTANYSINPSKDRIILVDATGGPVTVTLPDLTSQSYLNGFSGTEFVVKKIDSSANAVTVSRFGVGQTIDGAATKSLPSQYNFQRYAAPDNLQTGSLDWAVVG